jgi:hypothetical protein
MKGFIFILTVMLYASCKKENAIVPETPVFNTDVLCSQSPDSVYAFPEMNGGGYVMGNYWMNDTLWKYPCFNPNNSNEICFVEQLVNGDKSFIKYNLVTHEKIKLIQNFWPSSQPVWCENNWSYYNGNGRNICRINMNSGEVEQLTNYNMDIYITSNIQTGEFAFERLVTNSIMYALKGNATGDIIDTIWRNPQGDWRSGVMVGSERSQGIAYINPDGHSTTIVKLFGEGWWMKDVKIHPNDLDIYCAAYNRGLYKVNKLTGDSTLVKEGAISCYYECLSISQDGQNIVFEKINQEVRTGSIIYSSSQIWMMDIHGCNERRLF